MPSYDFRTPRLFVEEHLQAGAEVPLTSAQSHYLLRVLRMAPGSHVLVFNGLDGEWTCALADAGRKHAELLPIEQVRPQPAPADLLYLFAPLKHARLDYMVQKAVEMGAAALQPVLTQHTQAQRVNLERMRANAIEAAEQCGILALPAIEAPLALSAAITGLGERLLVFCDEAAEVADPLAALAPFRPSGATKLSLAVLIGPEGGFSPAERNALLELPRVVRIALGPRILRADTAAVAALALVQAVLGDWR